MESMIRINNLTKYYGKSRGIKDIQLEIEKGTIYGFIGPNGAGKSTTIKCIMNFINKSTGEIYVNNQIIDNKNYRLKEEIGYLPSEIHLYDNLTVKKMLDYSASFYKKDCNQRKKDLIKKLEIDENKRIDELSLGNLKKVGIVLALMHEPKVVIMDEATSGLDPLMQEKFYEILEEEKAKGTTIFFSSHILSEVKRICDKVAIIKDGQIIKIEDMDIFDKNEMLQVKITSKEINEILRELEIANIKEMKNDEAKFIYNGEINKFIKTISKYSISKLLIEELDVEDIFMHYYE